MAKVRVYELARELNIKNKALLEKLKELNITVSSHMSSLDKRAIAKVKKSLSGKKEKSVIIKRNQKTVIRRRKKRARNDAPASDATTPPPSSDEAAAVQPSPETDSGVSEKAKTTEAPPASKAARNEAKTASDEKQPGSVDKKKEKTDTEAVSSGKPSPGTGEKTAGQPAEEKALRKPMHKKETDGTAKNGSEELPSPDSSRVIEATDEKGKAAPGSEKKEDSPPPKTDQAAEDKKDVKEKQPEKRPEKKKEAGARTKRKKKKRAKKDMPAKIIKPAPKVEDAPKPAGGKPAEGSANRRKDANASGHPVKDATGRAASGKNKNKKKTDEKETRWVKKKISFKGKEVVEGDALYSRGRGKKGKRMKGKGMKGMKGRQAKPQKTQITTPKAIKRRIKIDETIVLSDLAKRMGIKANEMIKKLMMLGVMVTVNQTIDFDTAELVASEFEYGVEKASFEEDVLINYEAENDPEKMTVRPPVVTIMGHVDHGKTSLLDVIRKTRITEFEAGGITQHIGAYNVSTTGGQVTFLDTPGHEAFTSMRSRGATVTDIVVLVVAADDGVMPQTVEAINHSKAAEVPIIVAINKMDKDGADPDRVMRELSDHGLVPEDWGGDTIYVKVSAKKNQGIDDLLEMILLQAEVLELKADSERHAKGYVVEAKLDAGRGPVATILIQSGTLHAGDAVVCGLHHGKVRAMLNDRGQFVDEAGPSIPVEVLGLSGVPNAGDEMVTLEDDKSAKQISEHRQQKQRSLDLAKTSRISLEKLFERMQQGEVKDLNVILKADVHGSIEALGESLQKLSNDEVSIKIIHSATGTVSESDISLATVSDAIIIGFNVRPSPKIQALASEEHVDMRFYNVIYNVIKDVKDAILGMMESKYEERVLGQAEVRQVFHVPKIGAIAGCYVTDGKILRGNMVRLVRDGVIIHEGKISSLKRFKDDAKEVKSGYECGIGIENYNDIKVEDVIENFYLEEIKPELE